MFNNAYAFHTASNYTGTINALNGCLNDWRNYLRLDDHFEIPEENRQSFVGHNFNRELVVEEARKLPGKVKAGDLLIYSNSSHGTQVKDQDGDEVDGRDEALYTDDGLLITDDEIHSLLKQFVPGCLILGFFDNCHAGTMDRSLARVNWHYFPDDVTANVVFYLGCREEGTSADAYINGKYAGAFSYYLLQETRETDYRLTYLEFLEKTNEKLRQNRYGQVTQVACTKGMEDKKFGTM